MFYQRTKHRTLLPSCVYLIGSQSFDLDTLSIISCINTVYGGTNALMEFPVLIVPPVIEFPNRSCSN